jgi:hypothetical protein
MRDAIAQQQRALGDLERSRADSTAWSDDQRNSLDRNCLEPVMVDGRRLLDAFRKAGHEFAAAEGKLSR